MLGLDKYPLLQCLHNCPYYASLCQLGHCHSVIHADLSCHGRCKISLQHSCVSGFLPYMLSSRATSKPRTRSAGLQSSYVQQGALSAQGELQPNDQGNTGEHVFLMYCMCLTLYICQHVILLIRHKLVYTLERRSCVQCKVSMALALQLGPVATKVMLSAVTLLLMLTCTL